MLRLPTIPCDHCHGTGVVLDAPATGEAMRGAREAAHVVARALARKLGVSPSYVCDLERGKRAWTPEFVARYRAALATLGRAA